MWDDGLADFAPVITLFSRSVERVAPSYFSRTSMAAKKTPANFPSAAPPDRNSAAFVSYVYSHKRKEALPEVPRGTSIKPSDQPKTRRGA